MQTYNPKDWTKLILSFHKTDTFRTLIPGMILLGAYTFLLSYLEYNLKVIKLTSSPIMHSILGFVISLLLVFRTNTAYDRWWEGRKHWGSLVNCSRNLALKLNAIIPDDKVYLKTRFRILISNYAFALKNHLRGGFSPDKLEDTDVLRLQDLANYNHVPNKIAGQIILEIEKMRSDAIINNEHTLYLNEELRTFTDVAGACERIKKTPIPYSYSTFIKRIIFLYIVTLPLSIAHDLKLISIPIVLIIFYAFTSLELIAEEIEDPFGTEENDLPLEDISATIKTNLVEILR